MPANIENIVLGSSLGAWHGGGTVLPDDCLTWEQVVACVPELGMTVHKQPVYAIGPDGRSLLAAGYSACVRDDGNVLGINSDGYTPVQMNGAFDFMTELLQSGEAIANTAGTLNGGRLAFICCLAPEAFYIGGEKSEKHVGYISFVNSYDGSRQVGAGTGMVRIVCENTYNAAIAGFSNSYWFRHTKNVMDYLEEARAALQVGARYWAEVKRLGDQAIRASFSDLQFTQVLDATVPHLDKHTPRQAANIEKERMTLTRLFRETENVQNIRGTAWAAINAFTDFSDHQVVSKESKRNTVADNRFRRIMFDTSLKDTATAMIYEMAEIR